MKPRIYICHEHAESEAAAWLLEGMNRIFPGGINFFTSSDKSGFIGEDRWINKIEMALKDSSLVMVLCSGNSVGHPWLNFHAGAGWMAGKRVIILFCGDTQPKDLPQPLKSFQSYNLTNTDDFRNLTKLISFTTGLTPQNFNPYAMPSSSSPVEQEKVGGRPHAPSVATCGKAGETDLLQYIQALRANYEFDKRSGIHRHNITGLCVCTACLLEGMESPLTEYEVGWQCNRKGCEKFFSNPDFTLGADGLDYDPFNPNLKK